MVVVGNLVQGTQPAIWLGPVPASDWVRVRAGLSENGILRLYTPDGRLVLQQKVTAASRQFEIGALAPGMYLAEFSGDFGRWTQRVLIRY